MANYVIGLDLGSCSVKALMMKMALKGSEVVRFDSEPVTLDSSGRSAPDGCFEAAGRLFERLNVKDETVHCAIPGDHSSVRLIKLPSSASKRMEQVLKFELDELLPHDIDDAIFDFIEMSRSGDEIAVLVAVAMRAQVRQVVDGLGKYGVDPREIDVAPLCYRALADFRGSNGEEVVAFLDLGHQRTNVAVLDDLSPTARTVLRGGRDLTAALAEAGKIDFEEAEKLKRQYGLDGKVGEILRSALKPLVREIRQTLNGHVAAGGRKATRLVLGGGGASLRGLDRHLSEEIGIPAEYHRVPLSAQEQGSSPSDALQYSMSYALAQREMLQRNRRINVRRGELSFKGDFEFLKRRAKLMVGCAVAILAAWIYSTYAQYRLLSSEAEAQKAEMSAVTTRLFGSPILDVDEIQDRLSGKAIEKAPVPEKDAFDILVELSKRIPPSVVHDVETLEIKSKRITLNGIVDARLKPDGSSNGMTDKEQGDAGVDLSPTDLIKQKLEEFKECFSAIRVGKVTVAGERRRYQMDIDTKCP